MTNWQPLQDHGDPILHDLTIVPLRPQDQADVKRLILAGLTEYWGQLDATKNPDLNNIGATFAQATFLVAWLPCREWITGCPMGLRGLRSTTFCALHWLIRERSAWRSPFSIRGSTRMEKF
jgi:hypothetical protein